VNDGEALEETGSELVAAFARPSDALACALRIQRSKKKRFAIDTGERGIVERARRLLVAARPGQVLCSEETAVLLRRDLEAGVRLADLGVFRLRAGTAPERLFQAHREAESPATPEAERVYAGGLPLDMSPFHGRSEEIERLKALLVPGERSLVTLSGPGGIGKTRLALEAANRLLDAYRGEVWFVPLSHVAEARLVPDAIAAALHLPRGGDPLVRVAERLGHGPALLVLDNFEQLLDGTGAIRTLLERAGSLSCLVTSRQRLGLEGEREVAVAPLATPGGNDTPESLAELASVRLFVDRARAVRPDFQVTRANAKGLAELVRRLEGIPLALALAAGRAQVLTPEQLLSRLTQGSEGLDLLVTKSKDVPERHRTLRAAIEGSTKLLSPERQGFLWRLSVFRGGFTLEAAEAVCDEPLAVDALAELRECSLLSCSGEELRFSMLETLREFAFEQLEPAEREAVAQRHATHYAALAERAEPFLAGAEQGVWLDRLDAEQGNFRAAIESGPDIEAALRIAGALRHHWIVRGPIAEGRRLLEVALERSRAAKGRAQGTRAARASALMGAGALAFTQGDSESARDAWEEALELARKLGDRATVSRVTNNLGIVANVAGDVTRARALFEESAALSRELGDAAFGARAVMNLANVTKTRGDLAQARTHLEESARLSASAGDRLQAAKARRMLGDLCFETGDPAASASNIKEALATFEELGAREDVALALHSLARLETQRGPEHLERAVAILREIGARANLPVVLLALATVISEAGRAADLLDEGLRVARENGDRVATAHILKAQGDQAAREKSEGARSLYQESLRIFRDVSARVHAVGPLEGIAALDAAQGKAARAVKLLGAASALREATGAAGDVQTELLASLKAALDASFAAEWDAGRALDFSGAVDLAFEV
jgi:predicted ATPase